MAAALLVGSVPSAAFALDTDAEFWANAYGVETAHAAGLTGAGVKIAVIDKQINPALPVFAGRNLTVSDMQVCKTPTSAVSDVATSDSRHGSLMAALIIGNGQGPGSIKGMAPDADITFYGYGPSDSGTCRPNTDLEISTFGYLVKTAVDDGAEIITTSVTTGADERDASAIAYALARGVVIITAEPNADILADMETDIGGMNGVVAASMIDPNGDLQKDNTGAAFVIPQTTVVAAGSIFPSAGIDGDWNTAARTGGSSLAAPLVAGMLALAAQKTPQATGNQLVQALLATTNASVHEPTRTEDGYGYGAAWLPTLLSVDPTQFPDVSPLMGESAGKTVSFPTQEQIDTAEAEGFVPTPAPGKFFDLYEDSAEPVGFDVMSLVPWVVGGIVVLVLIGAAITLIVVITQRRKTGKGRTS